MADLTDGSSQNPINMTEQGVTVNTLSVWTNMEADGTVRSSSLAGRDCQNWTSSAGGKNGSQGNRGVTNHTGGGWTADPSSLSCNSSSIGLYCFEQD